MVLTKKKIIKTLGLEKHPYEGGYFKRTYTSEKKLLDTPGSGVNRPSMTSIYYLLTDDSPICFFNHNRSDIIHYHHTGSSIKYLVIESHGRLSEYTLGSDIVKLERPQLTVYGGCWKAAMLCEGEFALISEAVSPGFDFSDNRIATAKDIFECLPDYHQDLQKYIA